MTYSGFLLRFLIPPILLLLLLLWLDARRGRKLPAALNSVPGWLAVAVHVVIAVVYTTPWDNYLVATRVWWYDPTQVWGIVLGWVPLEEYLFFVLQTIMASLWLLWLARRVPLPAQPFDASSSEAHRARIAGSVLIGLLWVASVVLLFSDYRPGRYLALELSWALIPVLVQMVFGADILWHYRRLVLAALLPAWLYLCAADWLAIGLGTWIIAPDQSLGFGVGHLPIEEIIFFLLTNMLIVFGVTLLMARASHVRLAGWRRAVVRD